MEVVLVIFFFDYGFVKIIIFENKGEKYIVLFDVCFWN